MTIRRREPTFSVGVPDVWLTVNDIWPDGDAPENPTAADVVEVIRENHYTVGEVMTEWNLGHEITVFGNHDGSSAAFR